jgi:hypothetical protein
MLPIVKSARKKNAENCEKMEKNVKKAQKKPGISAGRKVITK